MKSHTARGSDELDNGSQNIFHFFFQALNLESFNALKNRLLSLYADLFFDLFARTIASRTRFTSSSIHEATGTELAKLLDFPVARAPDVI